MAEVKSGRLWSLDAYRGLIMLALAAGGFGLHTAAKQFPDSQAWRLVSFHTDHPEWVSNRWVAGVSFWDLIQPSFMFMVGVSMPFSYARRHQRGDGFFSMFLHAAGRSIVLILLGVFLSSAHDKVTNWTLVNVLTQIGLGYLVVFVLMGRPKWLQLSAIAVILIGYWAIFVLHPVPDGNVLANHFQRDVNAAARFDTWLLNLFPRPKPFVVNSGGYATLNFVPSIATMLFGLMAGELLWGGRSKTSKFFILVGAGVACMALGLVAGYTVCPIVKRIWTPSWALFSAAYTFGILAFFYLSIDAIGVRFWSYPLVVLGTNSILLYVIGQLLRRWTAEQLLIHIGRLCIHRTINGKEVYFHFQAAMTTGTWQSVWQSCSVMLVFWIVCWWLYQRKLFIRI